MLGLISGSHIIRGLAPPRPRKVIPAKVSYSFEGKEEAEEELTFWKVMMILKISKEDGWCLQY